jgi:hypothetical protein
MMSGLFKGFKDPRHILYLGNYILDSRDSFGREYDCGHGKKEEITRHS